MRDFNTETELNDEKIAELSEQYKGTLGFLKKYLFEAERTSMEKLSGTSGAIEVEPTVGAELIRRGFWGERRRALNLGKRFYKCTVRWRGAK